MWDSLKEQIAEVGSVQLTGADSAGYVKDNTIIFVYEGHKLLIPVSADSPIVVRHIGKGTVKLSFKFIEVLGKIEAQ
ncbi:MAG TPA: hypothetical protein O0X27_05075 [Methanocorpusculum sp.]|nr:hypothetical protein [Methanocorpusculum sp.]